MCIRHSYWSFRICMGILHRGPFSSGGVAVVGRGAPQLHQLGDKWARPPRRAELRLRLPTGTLCWRLQMGQSQGHAGNIAVYMRKRSHLINLLGQYCLFYVSVMRDQCLLKSCAGQWTLPARLHANTYTSFNLSVLRDYLCMQVWYHLHVKTLTISLSCTIVRVLL